MYGFGMSGEETTATAQRDAWRRQAAEQAGTLLFETAADGAAGDRIAGSCYLFQDPVKILTADSPDALEALMGELTAALADGFHVAGVLHYEAGYGFERVRNRRPEQEPLAWFGVYHEPEIAAAASASEDTFLLGEPMCLSMQTPKPRYLQQVAAVKRYIEAGDTYQVNLTTALEASYRGEVLPLYKALAAQQPAPFSALLHLPGEEFVLSFSPELFFSVDPHRSITVRPMKGTAARGISEEADQQQAEWLAEDEKNRAEHLMIVDLLRSDLGRLCQAGSIHADRMFEVERYRTLLQMTSTITASLRPEVRVPEILRALFPSGSMTGAPKPRTMEIIAELEDGPRGVYSGAIGFAAPDGRAVFNVAIRTVTLQDETLRMGVGGGIVADSIAEEEHAECWLKGDFLRRAAPEFRLLETLLWDGDFLLLDEHLERMGSSAEQLHFPFDPVSITRQMMDFSEGLADRRSVRVELARSGELTISAKPAPFWTPTLTVRLSPRRTWSKDSFLQHKTTYRRLYDEGTQEAKELGFAETVYANERDELTEGSISSLLLLLDGQWRSPALRSGVLPGVARTMLVARGAIAEQVLTLADLERAEAVALCNGVRGVAPVETFRLHDERTLRFRTDVALPKMV